MKKILISSGILLYSAVGMATPRSLQQAQQIAESFVGSAIAFNRGSQSNLNVAKAKTRGTGKQEEPYYIFNREDGNGFVIVSADDDFKALDWTGGCEDPRVAVTEDGLYVMMYTSWNHDTPRLSVATSRDLKTWQKHGFAFADAEGGRYAEMPCKSGSIVTRLDGDNLTIEKIGGKYLMYWGEDFVNPATSEDLIHWTPMLDENGELLEVIKPREGMFDSGLTECGPPAVHTKDGIVLIYNGKSDETGAYSAGQVLLDAKEPTKVLVRLDEPFLKPELDFEKSGQYVDGTVFVEGLVRYKGKWFLYYGCADSFVGLAVSDQTL